MQKFQKTFLFKKCSFGFSNYKVTENRANCQEKHSFFLLNLHISIIFATFAIWFHSLP